MAEGWDPSLALRGAPEGNILPNPLEFFGKMQALQQQQNVNLKFRQENDARVAVGDAYKQAIDPASGRLDQAKMLNILRGTGAGQIALPDQLAAANAREKEEREAQAQELALTQQRYTMIANTLGGLQVKGDAVTQDDVRTATSKLALRMGNDPKFVKDLFLTLHNMPRDGKPLADWIVEHTAAITSAQERLNLTHPAPVAVNTGAETLQNITNRLTGQVTTVSSTENMPTPQDRNAPQPDMPRDAVGRPLQQDTAVNTRPLVGGKGTVVNPGVSAAGKPIGPAPAALQTELSTTEDLNKYISSLHGQISIAEQNIKQIGSMRGLLESVRTGPFAEQRLAIAKAFQGLGFPTNVTDIINGGEISKAEEFAKKSFDEAYLGLKAMTPPGTQLTNGEVMAKWQNSPRLNMNPQAIEDLFNYSVEVFQYKKQERDFLNSWRKNGEHPSEAQAAWTREAINLGLIKPEIRDRGQGPGLTTPREVFSRGAGVPSVAFVTDAQLDAAIPNGRAAIIQTPTGPVTVRRTNNSFKVEK